MKLFDLQKALAGHPIVTRDGRTVKNFRLREEKIRGEGWDYEADVEDGVYLPYVYKANGKTLDSIDAQSDLFLYEP